MHLSRRRFFRALGAGAVAGTITQLPLAGSSLAPALEPSNRREPGGAILLDNNENAYGPSEKVLAAMRDSLHSANRYPSREYGDLIDNLAAVHKVSAEHILLGCGSTEILRVAVAALLGPGKKYVQAAPTLETTRYFAKQVKAEIVEVPLTNDFSHDLVGMLAQGSDASLIYICNPNNPTASLTPRRDIESFLNKLPTGAVVLVDEAYHHYAGQSGMYSSFADHPVDGDRVIVTRTFSKIYGLAGMRLGYAIAPPKLVEQMRPYITNNGVNSIAVRAAEAALDDSESVQVFTKLNADDRQEFFNQAIARMMKPIDSHANFVMMNAHQEAKRVIEHFRDNGIMIGGPFPPLDNYIRVSLGKPDEMLAFWRVWDALPKANMRMHH